MKVRVRRPTTGSRPFYGNFSLGLLVDSHPRFLSVIVAFVVVEVVFAFDHAPAVRPVAPTPADIAPGGVA